MSKSVVKVLFFFLLRQGLLYICMCSGLDFTLMLPPQPPDAGIQTCTITPASAMVAVSLHSCPDIYLTPTGPILTALCMYLSILMYLQLSPWHTISVKLGQFCLGLCIFCSLHCVIPHVYFVQPGIFWYFQFSSGLGELR